MAPERHALAVDQGDVADASRRDLGPKAGRRVGQLDVEGEMRPGEHGRPDVGWFAVLASYLQLLEFHGPPPSAMP